MLTRESKLKLSLGELKYQKQKAIMMIELIDKYIYRIEENIAKEKDLDKAMEEEYRNKDLVIEVEELLKEIKGDRDGKYNNS